MLRHSTSPVESVLTYATFFALSLALHMLVILGTRPAEDQLAQPAAQEVAERHAPAKPAPARRGAVTPDALLRDVIRGGERPAAQTRESQTPESQTPAARE